MSPKTLLTLITAAGLVATTNQLSHAQAINQKQPEPFQSNEQNPFSGDGFNPLDLIHNANLLNRRSGADFISDTNENLNEAAKDFKQQQLERMQRQLQPQTIPSNSENELEIKN